MDEEAQVHRLGLAERVDPRGCRVRQQHHVRLVDRLEAPHRRSVEGQAVLEHRLVECRRRDREVLHDAGQVAEADVDVLDALFLDALEKFFFAAIHRPVTLHLCNQEDLMVTAPGEPGSVDDVM